MLELVEGLGWRAARGDGGVTEGWREDGGGIRELR